MKKLLALVLIFLIIFSAFGCAKPDEETSAEPGVVDTPAPQPEKTPTPEKEPVTKEPTPDTQTKEPEKEEQPENEEPQPTGDKAPFCDVTIDEPFSPNEVVVTLTLEESKWYTKYTAEDFPKADCFYAFEFDYYPEEYHPEYKGRVTLMLMLNEPSKENVLKTVKILEQDSRVYSAEPNFITYTYSGNNFCLVKLSQEDIITDFNYDGIISVEQARINDIEDIDDKNELSKWLVITYDKKNNNEIIKSLLNDNRVSQVIPDYLNISVEPDCLFIVLTDQECQKELEYTVSDFPNLPIKEVKNYPSLSKIISVVLKNGGYQELFTVYNSLKNDERFEVVEFNVIGELVY